MRYIKQLCIILIVSFIGEILASVINLPIPASVYGLVLMLILLSTKIVKLNQVYTVSKYLIEIMPMLFIPAGVGLMTSYDSLKPYIVPVIIIVFVSTVFVLVVSGYFTQYVLESRTIIYDINHIEGDKKYDRKNK